ncbi:sodium/potassium-transporting ATPase subunit beta-1-like [Eurosta solidaginis]|uniref:sodium/potassium-transporting ATPase subunit beta-1-like n=1 Tax=Eurosta solidaginis TaxID=178769 RepID=UPI003530B882
MEVHHHCTQSAKLNNQELCHIYNENKNMFEKSGKYVVIKQFRRENYENQQQIASSSQRVPELNGPDDVGRKQTKSKQIKKHSIARNASPPRSEAEIKRRLTKKKCVYWLTVTLYYIFFYIAIGLLFYLCLTMFLLKLPKKSPRVLKQQPSLIYYPHIENYYNNRITWRGGSLKDNKKLMENIKNFLKKFGKHKDHGECREIDSYGYENRMPCVFLKVNRIAGFKFIPIQQAKDIDWREHKLKDIVADLPLHMRSDRLWISCKANSTRLHIEYFPDSRSISVAGLNSDTKTFDEYINQSNFEPFIAIQLNDTRIGEPLNVNCKMFAKNIAIKYSDDHYYGGVSFDMLMIT